MSADGIVMYVIKKSVKEVNYLNPTALCVLGSEVDTSAAFLLFWFENTK